MFRSKLSLLLAEKEQQERRKITQRLLADESGLSANTISAWMQLGRDMPRLDGRAASRLCDYFKCSLVDLVDVISTD